MNKFKFVKVNVDLQDVPKGVNPGINDSDRGFFVVENVPEIFRVIRAAAVLKMPHVNMIVFRRSGCPGEHDIIYINIICFRRSPRQHDRYFELFLSTGCGRICGEIETCKGIGDRCVIFVDRNFLYDAVRGVGDGFRLQIYLHTVGDLVCIDVHRKRVISLVQIYILINRGRCYRGIHTQGSAGLTFVDDSAAAACISGLGPVRNVARGSLLKPAVQQIVGGLLRGLNRGLEVVPGFFIVLSDILPVGGAVDLRPVKVGCVTADRPPLAVKAVGGDQVVGGVEDIVGSACTDDGA